MKYEFFEHTADAKFRAYGKDLNEQFVNAALAMTSILFDPKKVKSKIKKEIKIKGLDQKSLLYNLLEELLYLMDTEFFLLNKVSNLKIKDNSLRSITETFFSPVGSLYENLFPIQDYNQDDMLQYLGDNLEQPIDVFDFELDNSENNISLSWHLTTKEKEIVLNSIYSVKNQKVLNKLVNTINE